MSLVTMVSQNVNVIKDTERLSKCSRLQEAEDTWQQNAIPDLSLDTVLEGKNATKDIKSIEKKMKYGSRLKNYINIF